MAHTRRGAPELSLTQGRATSDYTLSQGMNRPGGKRLSPHREMTCPKGMCEVEFLQVKHMIGPTRGALERKTGGLTDDELKSLEGRTPGFVCDCPM